MFILFFLLLLNLGISFWNASVVGRYWTERSELSGGIRFMMWCGVIMAVSGFFVVYVTILTMIMHDLHLFEALAMAIFKVEMSAADVEMLVGNIFDLAYIAIIFPVLGTGLSITINSWIVAAARRDFTSAGIAIYNTGAQIHNVISAFRNVPRAANNLGSGLKLKLKSKDAQALAYVCLLLFPIVISLGGAIATTMIVMRASDAKYQLDDVAQS